MFFLLPSGLVIHSGMLEIVSLVSGEGCYLMVMGVTGLSPEDEKFLTQETGTIGLFYPELN